MTIYRCIVVIGLMSASPVLAQSMPLSTFLVKADALEAKGPLALMSSDLPIIKSEVKASMTNYRALLTAQKAAGKPLHSCPPAKGRFDSDDMMAAFRAVPVAQRNNITVQSALFAMMKKRHPCPA